MSNIADEDLFYSKTYIDLREPSEFDILFNFPLYGSVDKVLIGVDDDAEISKIHRQFVNDQKIILYGSSIEQGGCAGRPGMAEGNILSRWLNREVYNLGFNSSGKAEPEMAHVIAEIDNASALIISVEGNCPDHIWLNKKLRDFIEIYRGVRLSTSIIIMPFMIGGTDILDPDKLKYRLEGREIQQRIVSDLRNAGDENIHLLLRDDKLKPEIDGHSVTHEGTVDGLHLNDLGFYWSAKILYDFLNRKLETS